MLGVKYIGPVWDFSGYGEASRNYVLALHRAGVPITLQPHCFDREPPQVASDEDTTVLKELVNKDIDFDVVIVHLTPDHFPRYAKEFKGKHVIGYTVWETSLLHPKWADGCNSVSEIWVPCSWNVKAFMESGVTVPIHLVHHGINTSLYASPVKQEEKEEMGMGGDTFNFLSVMQWNYRKNPEGLIRAYFNAFSEGDDVKLTLKTYIGKGHPQSKEVELIREVVGKIKADMALPYYPRLGVIVDVLSSDKLQKLYGSCDAYVSLTHGEGFGLCMFEAGLAGKPVIATGATGNMEYMNQGNSYPVPFSWEYVQGMSTFNPWYLGNQQWAHANLPAASQLMREVYTHKDIAKEKGRKLRSNIIGNFSWDAVSQQMVTRLKEL